jgi:hypothetical protein
LRKPPASNDVAGKQQQQTQQTEAKPTNRGRRQGRGSICHNPTGDCETFSDADSRESVSYQRLPRPKRHKPKCDATCGAKSAF